MAKSTDANQPSINLVGTGTEIKGEILCSGDMRIDGTVSGKIKCEGKMVVGNTGLLEGELECMNADFSGRINARVEVSELLSLKATARFRGDMITGKLSIEPGATFTGTCTMDGDEADGGAGQERAATEVKNKPS